MDFSQPFCVFNSRGRFRGARGNYLPPLEYPEPPTIPNLYHPIEPNIRQELLQLKGQVLYLQGKLTKHIDKPMKHQRDYV